MNRSARCEPDKCSVSSNVLPFLVRARVLSLQAEKHSDKLAALMVTYPSTYGVFEEGIREIIKITHDNGGLVRRGKGWVGEFVGRVA